MIQQELINALPEDFTVKIAHEKYFDRLYIRVSNRHDLSIRVEWPAARLEFTIIREYEVDGGPYPTIHSIKELALILISELE